MDEVKPKEGQTVIAYSEHFGPRKAMYLGSKPTSEQDRTSGEVFNTGEIDVFTNLETKETEGDLWDVISWTPIEQKGQ